MQKRTQTHPSVSGCLLFLTTLNVLASVMHGVVFFYKVLLEPCQPTKVKH